MGAGARGWLLAAGGVAAAAGCVAIETAPGGVASVRLDAAPPSIVAGDSLRDSAGALTALRAVAFGEDGRPLETARVRYVFVPATDTGATGVRDTSLVVDSATGVVRATLPLRQQQGRVAAVVGERFQLVQTFEIVVQPDSLAYDAAAVPELRYECRDLRTELLPVPSDTARAALFQWNAVALPPVTVYGDTNGRPVTVPSRLMRWAVDSGPWPFPAGRPPRVALTAGGRDSVDAIAVIAGGADRARPLDTTSTSGVSSVRLRIRPAALGRDVVPERDFVVRVRALGQPGRVPLARNPAYVRVRLRRAPPTGQAAATCQ
jgi:hypothetical protein